MSDPTINPQLRALLGPQIQQSALEPGLNAGVKGAEAPEGQKSFAETLQESIAEVNKLQNEADQAVEKLVTDFPPVARQLAEAFWPGPLTIVLPKRDIVPDIVTSGLPTVAIRLPDHEITQVLHHGTDVPIAAPSARGS